jgi:hypothetical protein
MSASLPARLCLRFGKARTRPRGRGSAQIDGTSTLMYAELAVQARVSTLQADAVERCNSSVAPIRNATLLRQSVWALPSREPLWVATAGEPHTRAARACTSTTASTRCPGECTAQYRLRSHALRHIISSYMIRSVDRFHAYSLVPLLATSRPIGFGTSASRRRQRKDEDGQADLTERCVDNQASPRGDDAAPFTGACDAVATIVKVCRRVMGTSVRIGAKERSDGQCCVRAPQTGLEDGA